MTLFEESHQKPNATNQFVVLFKSIITCCPLSVCNYAEQMMAAVFSGLKKNPYKYSELLTVFEKMVSLNRGNPFMTNYIHSNLGSFCSSFLGFLEGKWQDSDFILHFAKLFGTILSCTRAELFKQKDFCILSSKLVKIFLEFNSYETRRDIMKLW